MVEQRTENPRVAGSIPALGIFFISGDISLRGGMIWAERDKKGFYSFVLLQTERQEVKRKMSDRLQGGFFHRKLLSYEIKTLREDRTAAEWKMSLVRPAAGGESCKAGFFFILST